jgi:hypothetical protein
MPGQHGDGCALCAVVTAVVLTALAVSVVWIFTRIIEFYDLF